MINISKEYDMINNIVNKVSFDRETTVIVGDEEQTTKEDISFTINENITTVDEKEIKEYDVTMKLKEISLTSDELKKVNMITNIALNSIMQYEQLKESKNTLNKIDW